MSSDDEVRRLRQDLDEVIHRTTSISQRLDKLEAARASRAEMVRRVLSVEEPQREPAKSLTAAFREAVKRGNLAAAERCIDEGVALDTVIEDDTALRLAIEAGQFEMVKMLVARGAKIEHGLFGWSDIRRAHYLRHDAIAAFLEQTLGVTPEPVVASPSPRPAPVLEPAAPIDLWGWLAASSAGQFVRTRIEEFRARTREIGWEAQLGTYWLPRVAVVCIAIAVVFFLSLAIERWGAAWMPHLRVAIGYAVCAGLLGMAWRAESKYTGLSRVLYGGGFAVMYFVTFATHYVRFAQVFASPVPTLLLLAAVVVAWAVAAQVRQSKIIAVLVTALGHLTVLLSILTLRTPGPFAVIGIVALSAGSAFFLLRNRWYYVGALGMVGSYINDAAAMAHSRGGDPHTDFVASLSVVTLFFLMFALAELFAPEELRRKTIPGWFRNAFVTLNTIAFLFLGAVIMSNFSFSRGHQDLFRFAAAALLLSMAAAYRRFRAGDPLYNVYYVKAIALATLALATRYGGNTLSVCLAVEMALLLVSARQSGLVVMRLLAYGVACVAFLQTLASVYTLAFGVELTSPLPMTSVHLIATPYDSAGYPGLAVRAALGIAAFFVASLLYQRTDWTLRSLTSIPQSASLASACWNLDLLSERPSWIKQDETPYGRSLIPYLYAVAGVVLWLAYAFPLVHAPHRFVFLAGCALALTVAAAWLRSNPFGLAAGVLFLGGAFPHATIDLMNPNAAPLPLLAVGVAAMWLVALASERGRIGAREGLAFHQKDGAPYVLYGICVWLSGLLVMQWIPNVHSAYALAIEAVAAGALVMVLHPGAFAIASCVLTLWAGAVFALGTLGSTPNTPDILAIAAIITGICLLADRYYATLAAEQSPRIARAIRWVFVVLAMLVIARYLEIAVPAAWRTVAVATACYAFLLYAGAFGSASAGAVSVAFMLFASGRHSVEAYHASGLDEGMIAGFVLIAAYWTLIERLYTRYAPHFAETLDKASQIMAYDPRKPETVLAPIGLATLLLVLMAERIPSLAQANPACITIGWFALAALLFATSLLFRQRFYRYSGLAVILLSLARLFLIDMKEQDPLLRVAAFAIVGSGLLAISVGYYKWVARSRG